MQSRHYPSTTPGLSLADSVAENLRQQLIHGQLHAGQRLSEASLSEQLDISRNTLREAFRILVKEGLLHHAPNRGVSVVVPSIADIIDIYRVRRLIECQALAQAWPRHPAHKRLTQATEDAQQRREAGDWQGVGSANMAFHAGIVALADSARLAAMFADIAAELRLAFGLLDDPEYLHAPFVDQNSHLLGLFESGDTSAAAQALEHYLIQSERMVLSVYTGRID
ncbi:GntR family transcriptional regulator [Castellaniella sp.]|uniref:GntR family transcriptional regulator n=1 Tax=Castellaniella sp. TaxID=1955812 RepID=UPI002AFE3EBC|nr:GntR family transcriptional regulator [Castellaniella sp.]